MIKITPGLLEKYHLGMCSKEERDAVESWLLGTDDEITPLQERTLEKMESNIWQRLSPKLSGKKTRVFPLKKMTRYAAVACVAAISVSATGYVALCNTGWLNTELAIDNTNGSAIKNIRSGPLEFSVLPEGKIFAIAKFCRGTVDVNFCGIHKIKNTSIKEVKLNINSQCNAGTMMGQVILKPSGNCVLYTGSKGKNYLIKNNNPYTLPPADWQRYRRLFLSQKTMEKNNVWS